MENKNILEFCLSPDLGGLELFMVSCYQQFQEQGQCHVMIAPQKKLDNFLEIDTKYYLKRNKFFPILPAIKLAKFIDKCQIDIIHFHWTRDIATVVLAKILSKRKPKVVQSRHMTMTRFKSDVYHKWLYNNIDMIHAVTFQVKEQLEKFIPLAIRPKVEVVHLGCKEPQIDTVKKSELQALYGLDGYFVVGMVGRIEEGKGQYLLLEAIAQLKGLNIKVLIVGHTMDEDYLNVLKHQIKTLGIENQIVFTGFTKEVNEHIGLCDVTVLATPKETFGLVIIESMINQVPVIATNNGGPLEIIEDGQDGLLFNRSSEDLASKIKMMYENNTLKEQLALNGYKKAKTMFNLEIQLEKLYKVMHES